MREWVLPASNTPAPQLFFAFAGGQCDGGLGRKIEESERFLKIEAHDVVGVIEIANGDILAKMQGEIAAASGEHERTGDGGRPDNFIVDETSDVLEHRVSVVARLGESSAERG
jgi:hypothetical protein